MYYNQSEFPGVEIRFFFEAYDEVIMLPVNPAELIITKPNKNETSEIIGLGEINLLKQWGLVSIKWEGYLPAEVNSNHPAVLTKGQFKEPYFYVNFFERLRVEKKPCRFLVSATPINIMVSIEDFERKYTAQDDDLYYRIELKEYKSHKIAISTELQNTQEGAEATIGSLDRFILLINSANAAVASSTLLDFSQSPRENISGKITIGSNVIINGRLHSDSYGSGAGQTLTNHKGKVNYVKEGRSHPYHVTNLNNMDLGWVTADSVKVE